MIIVMGLPGAGKSTVLNALRERRKDYVIANYGDMMLEIEKAKGWVMNRDEMRRLPIEKQKLAQRLVAGKLSKEKGKFILDTHCSVSTPTGYYPGLPFGFLKSLAVDKLAYITAGADEIMARRQGDTTRMRDADDVSEHDAINRSFLAAYAAFTSAPVVIIYNKHGKLEDAVKKMEELL